MTYANARRNNIMIIETNSSFYRSCRESEQHYGSLGRLGQTFEGGWYLWWIGL